MPSYMISLLLLLAVSAAPEGQQGYRESSNESFPLLERKVQSGRVIPESHINEVWKSAEVHLLTHPFFTLCAIVLLVLSFSCILKRKLHLVCSTRNDDDEVRILMMPKTLGDKSATSIKLRKYGTFKEIN